MSFKKIILIIACLSFVIVSNLYYERLKNQRDLVLAPAESIRFFTFGYDETLGDSFWVRALQDINSCEQNRGGASISSAGAKMGLDRTPSCSFSWVFHMLNLVLEIIPRFQFAARVGPVILSVIVDDIDGATVLFEKALALYPDDWVIASRAAYHYVFELEDLRRGAALYYAAAKLGAPSWMALYASKLTDKEGRKDMAIRMLKGFVNSEELKPEERKQFEKKIQGLEK